MQACLQKAMHGFNKKRKISHVIEVPKKVHRPKLVNDLRCEPSYLDVDEGHFLSEAFSKAVFRPRN